MVAQFCSTHALARDGERKASDALYVWLGGKETGMRRGSAGLGRGDEQRRASYLLTSLVSRPAVLKRTQKQVSAGMSEYPVALVRCCQ